MKSHQLLYVVVLALVFIGLSCAGSQKVLTKRYNQVAFAATHNGHSHEQSPVQNQDLQLSEQLEHGIRAVKIHVWYDYDKNGICVPFACHGMTKDILDGPFIDKIVEKVPRLFQGWARGVLQQMEPVNEVVRDACKVAYGDDEKPGVIQFKHCILDPAKRPLVSLLQDIKKFLIKHPQEIITIILEDHTKNLDVIADDFKKNGLDTMVHTQDIAKQWPTLQNMIQTNKRLVVLLHGDEKLAYEKYPWMHYIWLYAWDTEWDFESVSDLKDANKDIMPKRGEQTFKDRHKGPKNKLLIVHHFVTPMAGGCKSSAKKVNKKAFLQSRLERLQQEAGQIPNIIQVDFFQYPNKDIFEVVDALNNS